MDDEVGSKKGEEGRVRRVDIRKVRARVRVWVRVRDKVKAKVSRV